MRTELGLHCRPKQGGSHGDGQVRCHIRALQAHSERFGCFSFGSRRTPKAQRIRELGSIHGPCLHRIHAGKLKHTRLVGGRELLNGFVSSALDGQILNRTGIPEFPQPLHTSVTWSYVHRCSTSSALGLSRACTWPLPSHALDRSPKHLPTSVPTWLPHTP